MRQTSTIFSLVIGVCILGSTGAIAQGRGHGHHNNGNRSAHSDHHVRDHKKDHHYSKHEKGHHYRVRDNDHHYSHEVRHVYHHYHDRYCNHAPVVVHHYKRPRYIYYEDYDVYYDRQNSVYITYSGRNWSISTAIPVGLRYVNARNTKRFEVDYYDDDFPQYLERRRPSYVGVYQDW